MKSTYELPRLTRCPKCQTTFRVSNEQLRVAGGKVRCGNCDNVFNALFALVAEAPTASEKATPVQSVSDTPLKSDARPETLREEQDQVGVDAEIETDLKTDFNANAFAPNTAADAALQFEDSHAVEDSDASSTFTETDVSEVATFDEIVRTVDTEKESGEKEAPLESEPSEEIEYIELSAGDLRMESPFDDEEHEQLAADTEPAVARSDEAATAEEPSEAIDDDTFVIDTSAAEQPEYDETIEKVVAVSDEDRQKLEDSIPFAIRDSVLAAEKPGMSRGLKALLSVLALVLIATLAIQLAVFRGFQLTQQFPTLRPYVDRLCDYVDCSYTGPRDVKQIHLLNRDIRGIPDRPGVLLITATMRNDAAFRQPFPDFEIVLSDLAANVVAQRRFSPTEYLGTLGREQSLMEPRTPVQVQLEVLDPGADAVNFEINFY